MEKVPAEICAEIFAFACVDDGSTGRSLSRVSSFVRELSKPYKYQSISVIGHVQLFSFADILEKTPAPYSNVRSLLISAHPRNTASDPRALTPEYARRQQVYLAVARILRVVSPSIKVIHAFFVFYRPFPLLPIGLPELEELALHGPMETSTNFEDDVIAFPALKHLHVTSCCSPSYISRRILKHTPSLLHLRFSAPENSPTFTSELRDMLNNVDGPPSLEKIFIHLPTKPKDNFMAMLDSYRETVAALNDLAAQYPRLTLLPPLCLGMFRTISIEDAEHAWAESVAGRTWW